MNKTSLTPDIGFVKEEICQSRWNNKNIHIVYNLIEHYCKSPTMDQDLFGFTRDIAKNDDPNIRNNSAKIGIILQQIRSILHQLSEQKNTSYPSSTANYQSNTQDQQLLAKSSTLILMQVHILPQKVVGQKIWYGLYILISYFQTMFLRVAILEYWGVVSLVKVSGVCFFLEYYNTKIDFW